MYVCVWGGGCVCVQSRMHISEINVFFLFFYFIFFKPFIFFGDSFRAKPIFCHFQMGSYPSKNGKKIIRSCPYLDFELLFPPVRTTGLFPILSNRSFNNKTSFNIVIKYKFKSQN